MKKLLSLITVVLLLSGCTSRTLAPEWQSQAHAALTLYTGAYLSGNSRVADLEFDRARAQIARTGRLDLMARIELLRCATQVASLELTACAAYQALAGDAPPEDQAYASFITGNWASLDAKRLPQPYQGLVQHSQAQAKHQAGLIPAPPPGHDTLVQIEDPLARLVAAGSLIQREVLTSRDIDLAVETASRQGWRRPLLAWLGVQLKHQQTAVEADAAAKTQRRIDLVLQKN
jgi:hypothetical protein